MRLVKLDPSVREKSNPDLLPGAVPAPCSMAIDLHPRLSWHCGSGQPNAVTQYSSFCHGAGSGVANLELGENISIFTCSSSARDIQ